MRKHPRHNILLRIKLEYSNLTPASNRITLTKRVLVNSAETGRVWHMMIMVVMIYAATAIWNQMEYGNTHKAP
jgi:hypothetical protein